ncbi:Membrane-bound lytic murein transglycosylase B precursor [Roseovarius litorisediminis]|uniref:Membrane-bound lytic murein transglycosylase B n=1 Tax=Roseovarius litorisediminis TaxID=1312363 RepID=A0A1Y5RQD1_9RHOB|nr:lytic murein transglycosylase [Roseovarius litorisediminis]SLN22778.1 Membrane-bound lytic murein transglycosylase B precursor [Roseovarius litorisediminis]
MRVSILLAIVTGILSGTAVLAAPVESSIRPQLRPGSGVITPASVVVIDVPVRSLRPKIRPAQLGNADNRAETILVVSSNPAFDRWIKGFRGRAVSAGIKGSVFDNAFHGVRFNADVVHKDRNQAEFKRQIWDYLDSAASPPRIEGGKKALRKHSNTLRRIEQKYGVDKEIVTAIWGLESYYGTRKGDIPLIEALATLAFDGRRGKFFEGQLIAALKIIQSGDVSPRNMTGSWAGAMGHTQFIPTSYLAYAVDFTDDGKRDIWSDDPSDALASTAAYLRRFGWKKGQPWGVEVRLPKGFNPSLASRKNRKSPAAWAAQGVVGFNGKPVPNYGNAAILLPAGSKGAAFMIFDNFAVIERYNNADAYVIGVGHLADRLKGGPGIQANWPRGYDPLSFDQRMEMQRRLQRKGYGIEKIDGIIGPNTTNAIRAFQNSVGVKADGYPSQTLLRLLKGS